MVAVWCRRAIDPQFDQTTVNITVTKGKVAVLPCSIEFLNEHEVRGNNAGNYLAVFATMFLENFICIEVVIN